MPQASESLVTLYAQWTDAADPVITGIENGKNYRSARTVMVADSEGVKSVTANGNPVTLDNGQFTLLPVKGEQKVVVTDEASNMAEMTVTVSNGHVGGLADCTHKAL